MKYKVVLRFEYPAHDEKDGIVYEGIEARNKTGAIRDARRQAANDGHIGVSGKGKHWFYANESQ